MPLYKSAQLDTWPVYLHVIYCLLEVSSYSTSSLKQEKTWLLCNIIGNGAKQRINLIQLGFTLRVRSLSTARARQLRNNFSSSSSSSHNEQTFLLILQEALWADACVFAESGSESRVTLKVCTLYSLGQSAPAARPSNLSWSVLCSTRTLTTLCSCFSHARLSFVGASCLSFVPHPLARPGKNPASFSSTSHPSNVVVPKKDIGAKRNGVHVHKTSTLTW